ncbi:MAG: hypothetical protein ACKOOI_06675, partial [Pirellula sp.]
LVVGAVLSVAHATVAGTMETTPCPVQTSEHPAAMESATMQQLTLMGTVQAVGAGMREVSSVIGATTLPSDSAWAASNRAVASIARVVMPPTMSPMQTDAPGRADDGQG